MLAHMCIYKSSSLNSTIPIILCWALLSSAPRSSPLLPSPLLYPTLPCCTLPYPITGHHHSSIYSASTSSTNTAQPTGGAATVRPGFRPRRRPRPEGRRPGRAGVPKRDPILLEPCSNCSTLEKDPIWRNPTVPYKGILLDSCRALCGRVK